MNRLSTRSLRAGILAAGLAMLSSCGGGDTANYPQQVQQYFNKDIALASANGRTSAYFDLSDGVVLAYKGNADAAQFLNATVQRITSNDSCDVYSMAADQITPLKLKQTELYNKVMDEASYAQEMAPIERTLGKIVKDGTSALLVTDFEEFTPDRHVQHQSFATRYFVDWLKRGNDITFFVFDFIGDRQLPYHLYFIVFDNKGHELLTRIKECTAGVRGYREFHLSRDAYSATTSYPSAIKGGNYHDAASGEDLVTSVPEDGGQAAYHNYGQGARLEYYPLGVGWADALKNAKDATQPGYTPTYTALFRNLFFDFSNTDSYLIRKLGVRVTDVEEDFAKYCDYQAALAVTDKASSDYYDENGHLLPDYDYTRQKPQTPEIHDMLELDQQLFQQTMAQSGGKKAEMGITFSPNFHGDIVGGQPGDLYRVDIVIAEAQPNIGPHLDQLFSWGLNNNLRDAIRNTLLELNPKGTVIYSYFVKAL